MYFLTYQDEILSSGNIWDVNRQHLILKSECIFSRFSSNNGRRWFQDILHLISYVVASYFCPYISLKLVACFKMCPSGIRDPFRILWFVLMKPTIPCSGHGSILRNTHSVVLLQHGTYLSQTVLPQMEQRAIMFHQMSKLCEASVLTFPLTTKYGDERKPSGRQWDKIELDGFSLTFCKFSHVTFNLDTVFCSQN